MQEAIQQSSRDAITFMSLWSINDALEPQALRDQLDELKHCGMEGVIFHPRFYPNEPLYMSEEYLAIVSGLILYAKSIGMAFWIYDEDGWPSGTASGQVIARNPELKLQWLELHAAEPNNVGADSLVFFLWEDGEERRIGLHAKTGVSSLEPAAAALFVELTHERYRMGLAPEAFDHVTGFFSDEVAFLDGHGITYKRGGIPWHESFPERYRGRYGEELLPKLPLLFADGEGSELTRARYWEMLTDTIIAGFYKPIADWCEAHGKLFTAHLKAEENPFFQLSYSGSAYQVLKEVSLPALDALERYPGNHYYPRMVHSISVQQGRGGTLVEAMGGAGWGVTPESFKRYILWLASHGSTQFVMHLNQLRLKMQAVHDWPPSIPSHLTWKEAFPAVLRDIKTSAAALPDLRAAVPELLIVTPTRGVMGAFLPHEAMAMNEHDGSCVPDTRSGSISNRFIELVERCHASGIHYELTEERVLEEEAVIGKGVVRIGYRVYSKVFIPNGCQWNVGAGERTIPDLLREAGVEIVDGAAWPSAVGEDEQSGEESKGWLAPQQSQWVVHPPERNRYTIELKATEEDGAALKLMSEIRLAFASLGCSELSLLFLDPMRRVTLNGRLMQGERRIDGAYSYVLPSLADLAGDRQSGTAMGNAERDALLVLTLEAEPYEHAEPNQLAFLEGSFLVTSESPYREKDQRQCKTEGPFVIRPFGSLSGHHLVAEGLPFCSAGIEAVKIIIVERELGSLQLRLMDTAADCAQVYVNGEEIGWCWSPDWRIELPEGLPVGTNEVRVRLLPSTYNSYGPHRHYEGDRYLTSPAQYSGVRNFADSADAPDFTLGDEWHFIKWHVRGEVKLQEA